MSELIKLETPELEIIEKSKAEQIRKIFVPMSEKIKEFEDDFNEIIKKSKSEITNELTQEAKRLRLDIAKVRIGTEKIRKEQKEEYLRAGKAIDGVSNILKWAVTEKENKLKEIENYFEEQERIRLEKLQEERIKLVIPYYTPDYRENYPNFSIMEQDVFDAYLSSKKKAYEDKIEAERIAEEERIAKEKAEAEERERIKKENEKLKKEAEERERQRIIEEEKRAKEEAERKAKEEFERKAREEKDRIEREEYEAKLRKEREEKERIEAEERAKREELEAKLKKEREERLKAERIAKEEAERKAKEESEKIERALKKGDSAKIEDLISDFKNIKTKYTFKSKVNQKKYVDICIQVDNCINYLNK